ncbi:metallophosphatase [Novosphingobium marinum]|uniref:Serine/threonine protein phosphatase 1 n=2 Tax=Novosphingobium marinum TaxID=1514948 RepID=A0A7Z0BWI5_9SPHN|nr:metallophosphoesterase [Novosphingobium marinum]NYH96425.1 serine/threonine protein phosphatase 1 [Novosphingobium marinum]GGC35131.1 metallophosphatase [Novosphingobium marinum]
MVKMETFRQLFSRRASRPGAGIPTGERVYAVGDVHGRLDLLRTIATAIDADESERPAARTTIVLLGDLVDRGPQSAQVIDFARQWQQRRRVRILSGNHEEMFLLALERLGGFRAFLRSGGRETVLSYGVDAAAFHGADLEEAHRMMVEAVPQDHVAFMRSFEDTIRIGDYLFVHAGIRPEAPLERQDARDFRWIREPFLSHSGDHGAIVVHGHTISDEPAMRGNRIGIDTGAFMSGRLTALGLEGTDRWLIETIDREGTIGASIRAA